MKLDVLFYYFISLIMAALCTALGRRCAVWKCVVQFNGKIYVFVIFSFLSPVMQADSAGPLHSDQISSSSTLGLDLNLNVDYFTVFTLPDGTASLVRLCGRNSAQRYFGVMRELLILQRRFGYTVTVV